MSFLCQISYDEFGILIKDKKSRVHHLRLGFDLSSLLVISRQSPFLLTAATEK
jgi:hypothetical protein